MVKLKQRVDEKIGGGFFVARRSRSSGRIRFSYVPFEHDTIEGARERAKALAAEFPNRPYEVLQVVDRMIIEGEEKELPERVRRPILSLPKKGIAQ